MLGGRRADVDRVDVGRVDDVVGVGRSDVEAGDTREALGAFELAVADGDVVGVDQPELADAVHRPRVEAAD